MYSVLCTYSALKTEPNARYSANQSLSTPSNLPPTLSPLPTQTPPLYSGSAGKLVNPPASPCIRLPNKSSVLASPIRSLSFLPPRRTTFLSRPSVTTLLFLSLIHI